MQLQTLQMEFFGPYRNATVNFERFAKTPLFLISGNTGSGKTTIFDGLVFALYGDTSGDQRTGEELRANFATPKEKTRVTLRFHHNGHDYEIWREPAQLLAKKQGGVTSKPMNACLTVYTDGKESGQWTKKRDIAPRINQLLHLDADQFRQIILLPQGQFRQFLDANSDDKGKLLQRLFGTGLYARWQDAMNQQAKEAVAKVKQATDRLVTLAGQFAYDADRRPADGATLSDQIAAMKATVAALTAQQSAQQAALKQATAKYEQANTAYQSGQQLQQAFDAQQAAQAALARLAADGPARAEKTALLAKLEWVDTHSGDADRLISQEAELTQLEAALTNTRAALKQAEQSLTEAQQTKQALAAQTDEMTAASKRETQLSSIRPQLERVARLAQALGEAQNQQEETLEQQQTAQHAVDQAKAALQANADALETLTKADQTAVLQTKAQQLASLKPVHDQWRHVASELKAAQGQVATAQAWVKTANAAAEAAQAAYTQLHDDQLRARIASLAAQLTPGAACPVCGSTEHPHPAVATETAVVTDEQVEEADYARQKAQADLASGKADLAQAQTTVAKLTDQEQALATELAATGDPEQAFQQLTADVDKLQQEADSQKRQLTKLKQQAAKLQTNQEDAEATLKHADDAFHRADAALTGAESALKTAQQALPKDAPSLSTLNAELTRLQTKLKAFADDQAKSETALSTAKQAVASAKATQTAQDSQHTQTQTALTAAKTAFEQAVADNLDGATVADFAELRHQVDQITAIRADLESAKTAATTQTALLKQAKAQIGDAEAPDLTILARQREAASTAQSQAQADMATAQSALQQDQHLLSQIDAAYTQNQDAQTRAESLSALASVMNGNNERKLSLERFVLRAYLQEVLTVANTRLGNLTAGRYQFQLHQEPGSHRNDSGLEIDVYDDEVGATRSVHTLSGGESFIAALSLALALGEVIQREAGGVSIDALFVDEGFGSLDSTSLHTAMEALETIEGQARMIGIISHVAELRASVPDQLQVTASGTGESTLREAHADR
ncbi:AAA family ATPase [Lacticaseibacillus camelliae]|uniref:Nuclease SbcCD subunit C n=1 Tax=Lacticaseibacillus camelliae DSM 22697 = JCM 13995 TaxID=1423730 RepID=A0A0R2F8L1_9LACO|nr:SMC family ATPase [Lacticaseibacillus camelliae]KRN21500.1 DNA repair ATPase SbcC [Lacticaseibacillus camelliae DSM 22697 = JCM 13995]